MDVEFRYEKGQLQVLRDKKPVDRAELMDGMSPAFQFYVGKCFEAFENATGQLDLTTECMPKAKMSLDIVMEKR